MCETNILYEFNNIYALLSDKTQILNTLTRFLLTFWDRRRQSNLSAVRDTGRQHKELENGKQQLLLWTPSRFISLSTPVSAFISLALVVVLVLHTILYDIRFWQDKLYLAQVNILKLNQIVLDQLLILDGIKLFQIFIIKYYFVLTWLRKILYDSVVFF